MLTDQGVIEGDAAATLRLRQRLAPEVAIFADHMVKHATPLGAVDEIQSLLDLRERGLADVIIVSGRETGAPVDGQRFSRLRQATAALLLIVSAAMAASIYSLSGRAYVQERASILDLAWLLRHGDQPTSILAILAPAAVDVLFFLPWGALTFLAIDRENIPRRLTYLAT